MMSPKLRFERFRFVACSTINDTELSAAAVARGRRFNLLSILLIMGGCQQSTFSCIAHLFHVNGDCKMLLAVRMREVHSQIL